AFEVRRHARVDLLDRIPDRCEALDHDREARADGALVDRLDDRGNGLEVLVQRALADAGRGDDVIGPGARVAPRGKHRGRDIEHVLDTRGPAFIRGLRAVVAAAPARGLGHGYAPFYYVAAVAELLAGGESSRRCRDMKT